jgi:leukotriene-A4 hydrolase
MFQRAAKARPLLHFIETIQYESYQGVSPMKILDPHSYADLEQGRITHIDFQIQVDFKKRCLQVHALYTLDCPIKGSFYMDTYDLNISKIHSNGERIDWEIDDFDPMLGGRLHLKGVNGISEFSVDLTTSPEASALQWLEPAQTAGGKYPFLYSQCQAIHARSIFPCQDTPSVRFTYAVEIAVESPLTAVMAAAQTGSQTNGDINQFSFKMPQPIPSYLFALGVGNLTFRDLGPRCGIFSEPEIIEAAAWEFAENEAKMTEAEKLFGPYVWERYDILVLPPSFPYGGMENPRLTFLSPIFLLGDRSETIIVAHELAHAWTGNLVTNATWEDFWLNEGWTTFAHTRIIEALEGRDYAQFRTALSRIRMLEDMDRFGMRSPLTCLWFPMHGLHPDEIFSSIPYHKGCAFLMCLEETVGREAFDQFIKKYIDTFRFRSITTPAFIEFLQTELPEVASKVDIQKWLYRPGFPEDAPPLVSQIYDDIADKANAFANGLRPQRDEIKDWKPDQVQLFLKLLPERISVEDCSYLEQLFKLQEKTAAATLSSFYTLAIRSGYQNVLPGIEHFIATIGRHFLVAPVMRAMTQSDWARNKARPIFERYRSRHHPITVNYLEKLLIESRL